MLKTYFLSNAKNTRGKWMCTFYTVDPKEELYLCTSLSSRTLGVRRVLGQNKGHYINSQNSVFQKNHGDSISFLERKPKHVESF